MRGGTLVVADRTSRLQVDHRLPLRIYYRAADSILRQARIYRKESNLIDLYVLLLRFSSLVMETIPQHRDYRAYLGREKTDFKKRLLDVLTELETLKPLVQKEVSRYNDAYSAAAPQSNALLATKATVMVPSFAKRQSLSGVGTGKGYSQSGYNSTPANSRPYNFNKQESSQGVYNWQQDLSIRPADSGNEGYPEAGYKWNGDFGSQTARSGRQQNSEDSYNRTGILAGRHVDSRPEESSQVGYHLSGNLTSGPVYSGAHLPQYSSPASSSLEDRMSKFSLSIPAPTSESLSRHSFLPPSSKKAAVSTVLSAKVQYPSLMDSAPTVTPSLDQNWQSPLPIENLPVVAPLKAVAEPIFYNEADMLKFDDIHSSLVDTAVSLHSQLSRQPSPPPVAAEVQSVPFPPTHDTGCAGDHLVDVLIPPAGPLKFSEECVQSRSPKQLHISVRLMDEFMAVALGNIKDNLETCGVLAGSLKEGVFYVTTLIVPKQEATANSCSTLNEEEIFEYQDKHDLFQFGWIHTHPSQSCFMSSIDLHTHYSYQVMLPEALAIVMAPTDSLKKHGIFRLAEPGGIKVIQSCEKRGFHAHDEPEGGGSIYEQCKHVLLDPQLTCSVVDLR